MSEQSLLVLTVTQPSNTIFTDSNLDEAQGYYYIVYVVNDLDESAGSNVRLFNTVDLPPAPVVLDPPSSVGVDRLTLTWSVNNDTDFQHYKIYRSSSPGVTESDTEVATITDRLTTFFDDSGLDTTANDYYYRVYVYDAAGNSSRSNEVTTAIVP